MIAFTCILYRADTGDDGTALFHSNDARVQLRVPAGIAGDTSVIRIAVSEFPS